MEAKDEENRIKIKALEAEISNKSEMTTESKQKNNNVVAVGVRRERLFQMLLKMVKLLKSGEAMANVAIKDFSSCLV